MHRSIASVSLSLVVLVALPRAASVPTHVAARKSPAQVCQTAVRAFAALKPPATAADVVDGIDRAIRLTPSTADLNNFPNALHSKYVAAAQERLYGSALWLDPTNVDVGSLTQAILTHDGPVAAKLLGDLQRIYAAMDRAQKKEKLPSACTSKAFGSAYFRQAAPVVMRELALTGDFGTDVSTACTRLVTKINTSEANTDVTDISSVEDLVKDADNAFRALQIDLRAITPPAANAQSYAPVQHVVDDAVKKLDKASNPSTSSAEFRRLGAQLSALGDQITTAAKAAGLNC
jgi:hypothetical protein